MGKSVFRAQQPKGSVVPPFDQHEYSHQTPAHFMGAWSDLTPSRRKLIDAILCTEPEHKMAKNREEKKDKRRGQLMSSMEEKKETPGAQKPKGRERRHSCQQCDKSFTTSGNLKRHLHIHTGEKPYSCEECGKTFTRSGDLKIHQRIRRRKTVQL
ncbi:zinc finger protein with KRAB and SCAN domains 1-like [Gymnodraco acuticeps]|uniref:Zinc finger protein with KRAB and SCAN domains 1-like n=1 Tax=Gymnodraco acuticeps TaxID=8218 RepID=A0A6P8V5H5_GYMAC|nr:zinc finger protein with KRAB and SCAN domains 1-like [Gymnodraco acuticeps]